MATDSDERESRFAGTLIYVTETELLWVAVTILAFGLLVVLRNMERLP
jgi:hypothetical protein